MTDKLFTNYFTQTRGALQNFALKLSKDPLEAENLVQEAAIRAYRGKHTYKTNTNFKNWAFTILKNVFINQYRKKKRRNTVNFAIEDIEFLVDSSLQKNNGGLVNLYSGAIYQSIEELSMKSKQPLKLYIEGYQYAEISDQLNIPLGTVKSRINFARKKLRAILNEKNLMAA